MPSKVTGRTLGVRRQRRRFNARRVDSCAEAGGLDKPDLPLVASLAVTASEAAFAPRLSRHVRKTRRSRRVSALSRARLSGFRLTSQTSWVIMAGSLGCEDASLGCEDASLHPSPGAASPSHSAQSSALSPLVVSNA
eukprot:scaffold774_cov248-Pinguiococcus_pyrenoidosus.AAC.4